MQAITARYVQEAEDWAVTVAGLGKELNDRAPGIIAARDRADQLVEKLAPEGSTPTVVHLLNGSALEFTSAYMTARLARPEPGTEQPAESAPEAKAEASKAEPKDKPAEPKDSSAKEDAAATETKPRKRNVPRKELSKSPQPAAEKETKPRGADGRYARTTAAGLPGSAGSASAGG
ncbi:hypothetical protein [Prauserella flavalba]|uniref:hypothetical protein n=1 Tax=Prauserella flavalba TaxID=1477506 RepID=UPI0036E09BD0